MKKMNKTQVQNEKEFQEALGVLAEVGRYYEALPDAMSLVNLPARRRLSLRKAVRVARDNTLGYDDAVSWVGSHLGDALPTSGMMATIAADHSDGGWPIMSGNFRRRFIAVARGQEPMRTVFDTGTGETRTESLPKQASH